MTAPVITPAPINGQIVTDTGLPSSAFSNWLSAAFRVLFDVQNSGTTGQRPTTFLYAGKFYFDVSLGANGKPIWMNKGCTGWIDATGAPV